MLFNPVDYPACLSIPWDVMSAEPTWLGHAPFAYALVAAKRPKYLVELGVHHGDSYLTFCQAVRMAALDTLCVGIDTFSGDVEMGEYGPEILAQLQGVHDKRYSDFSELWQMTFSEASQKYKAKVDLLHIDGQHRYEAVKKDFLEWEGHLSDSAVVLFHDTVNVYPHFGVDRFFSEVAPGRPRFKFHHSCGLGVLLYGKDQPAWLEEVASGGVQDRFVQFFTFLGAHMGVLRRLNGAA